jgi:hypothetical protein
MIYKDKMTSKLGLLGDRKEAAGRAVCSIKLYCDNKLMIYLTRNDARFSFY